MLCPNCGNELMNVNGRNVCVECGKDFSESELQAAVSNSTEDVKTAETVLDSVETPKPVVSETIATVVNTEVKTELAGEAPAEASEVTAFQEGTPIDPFEVVDPVDTTSKGVDPGLVADANYFPTVPNEKESKVKAPVSSESKKIYFILAIGGFFLLLLLGGGIFAYLSISKKAEPQIENKVETEWEKYTSSDFVATLPKSDDNSKETLSVNGNSLVLDKVSSKQDGVTYAIASGALPTTIIPSAELTEFVQALAKSNESTVNKTERTIFEGQLASDYTISKENNYIKGRVILKNNKIYILEYISKGDTSDNYKKFIDSFSFSVKDIEGE
jgi:hypothetical protein